MSINLIRLARAPFAAPALRNSMLAMGFAALALQSGVSWPATAGDAFLIFSLFMLMFEFIKATRQGKSFVEHFLSLCLAGGAAAEFWLVREAGNSTFLLLVVICFVDLFAGFAASLRRARRAVVVPEHVPVVVQTPPPRVEPARIEPARSDPFATPEPAPAAPMPRAEPVVRIEPVQKVES